MNASSISPLLHEDLYNFSTPVVVVLARPWESYDKTAQTLLEKILTSVKVDINSVRLVVEPAVDLRSLEIYSPTHVLIFGAETPSHIAFYQETAAQGFIVIRADDLSVLDDQKKKNLWIALRKSFGV